MGPGGICFTPLPNFPISIPKASRELDALGMDIGKFGKGVKQITPGPML